MDCYVYLIGYKDQESAYEYVCSTHEEAEAVMAEEKLKHPERDGWYVVCKDVSWNFLKEVGLNLSWP